MAIFLIFASMGAMAGVNGCKSHSVWNPLTTNWNNAFPIVIAGIKTNMGSHPSQPHRMKEPAICTCDHVLPVGMGMTYWEPDFVAEVVDHAGCSPTLGGVKLLPSSIASRAQSNRNGGTSDESNRGEGRSLRNMQVHWFNYPVFAVLNVFSTLACGATSGFDLADVSGVDPTWKNSLLADIMHPLTFLVANLPATLACIPDAIASSAHLPINSLFWCMGSQGTLYPAAGWIDSLINGNADANFHMLGRYMQNRVQMGGMLTTIGPAAKCNSIYTPTVTRDQYRFQPIAPVTSNRTAIMGRSALQWAFSPPLNPNPNRIDNSFLVWQGKQCCVL